MRLHFPWTKGCLKTYMRSSFLRPWQYFGRRWDSVQKASILRHFSWDNPGSVRRTPVWPAALSGLPPRLRLIVHTMPPRFLRDFGFFSRTHSCFFRKFYDAFVPKVKDPFSRSKYALSFSPLLKIPKKYNLWSAGASNHSAVNVAPSNFSTLSRNPS